MKLDGMLEWRCIGPFRGGRVVAVAGDVRQQNVFYFGACAGGVWKSDDAGTYWQNITDGWFNTASIGALAVSVADSNVIYAGTGETTIRLDVTHGDGVYRSTDAGRSWTHCGLQDTRHIAKVRIHPQNPDIAWVAAFGHAFGPNRERGVYKTVDGGRSWQQVLFKSERAGAIDLSDRSRTTRVSCMRPCGRLTVISGTSPAAGRTAASGCPVTAAKTGRTFRAIRDCRKACVARLVLPPRRRDRDGYGR